jgi:hypothetical protein
MTVGGCGAASSGTVIAGLRLWPFLALPAVDESPRAIRQLLACVRGEAAVYGAFFGSDPVRDAALTRTAALRSALGTVLR